MDRELVPLTLPRESVPQADQVRSTLLTSALSSLKDAGLFGRYVEALPEQWRARLPSVPAGAWLPIEYADVHYRTGDSLNLQTHEIYDLGNRVGQYSEKTILSLMLSMAKESGATPAAVLTSTPRFFRRTFIGGAVTARLTGPKDAIFETLGLPMARYRYFRIGYRALLTGLLAPFCTKVYLREIPAMCSESNVAYNVSWA